MFKKVAFTYYPVTDVARARKFYEETLGLKSGSSGNQVRLRGQSGRAADIMQ
jgi:extradiol dioxygenase family protein